MHRGCCQPQQLGWALEPPLAVVTSSTQTCESCKGKHPLPAAPVPNLPTSWTRPRMKAGAPSAPCPGHRGLLSTYLMASGPRNPPFPQGPVTSQPCHGLFPQPSFPGPGDSQGPHPPFFPSPPQHGFGDQASSPACSCSATTGASPGLSASLLPLGWAAACIFCFHVACGSLFPAHIAKGSPGAGCAQLAAPAPVY